MLFNTKKFVPLIYRSSRDYEALLRLLDVLLTSVKYETDTLINLYIPEECPETFLPLLAEHIGYEYNYTDSINENRIIINNFSKMIRNKGSVTGIKLASALSLNSMENRFNSSGSINDLSDLDVFFNYETGTIIILYSNENVKVRNLIDWVRPVGMYYTTLPSIFVNDGVQADLSIHTGVNVTVVPYTTGVFSKVESSEIYDGIVALDNTKDVPYTWRDCLISEYTWETISKFTWEDFLQGTDISRTITVTFDGDGGTFSVPNVINTFKGFVITTLSGSDVTRGIDKLEKWVDVNTGVEYASNTEIVINSTTNVTLKAVWTVLQQHSCIINLDTTEVTGTLNIYSMFYNTPYHIMSEHQNTGSDEWELDVIMNPTTYPTPSSSTNLLYQVHHTSGKLKFTIGYDNVDEVNTPIYLDHFINNGNTLYKYAETIDFSGLNEITYDIFKDLQNYYFMTFINYAKNIIMFPNITELSIPNGGLFNNCLYLENITFPMVNCNFLFKLNNNHYGDFLTDCGYSNSTAVITIPSNITMVYENYGTFTGNSITNFLTGTKCHILNLNCNFTSSVLTDNIPKLTLNNVMPEGELYLNGKFDLWLWAGSTLNYLYIGPNCSLNNYSNLNWNTDPITLRIADELVIDTDDYGATTKLTGYCVRSGYTQSITLGRAINELGEYALSLLPYLLTLELPNNITYIPKTAIQENAALTTLTFNTALPITIQGCHNLPSITNIYIPSNCINLNTCFYHCTGLETLNLGNVTNFDYETSFVNCLNLTTIINNSTMFTVDNNILYNSDFNYLLWIPWSIRDVIIPDNIQYIGSYSFSGCPKDKLNNYVNSTIDLDLINYYDNVVIPESVTTIYENAFNLTNITSLTVLNSNLNLTNLAGSSINEIKGHINSTAHMYANTNNITFIPLDEITDNVNANITDILGTNIL